MLAPVLTAVVYWPARFTPQIFDDTLTIEHNPTIRHLSRLDLALSPPPEHPFSARPLANFSFAVDYALYDVSTWGYRLTNGILHVVNAWLLLWLLRTTLAYPGIAGWLRKRRDLVAGLVTLLWVVHPLHTETIIYLTQRTELLVSMCYLLTLAAAAQGFAAACLTPSPFGRGGGEGASSDPMAGSQGTLSPALPQRGREQDECVSQRESEQDESVSQRGREQDAGVFAHPSSGWFALAVLACFAGMASKEVMVSAPLAVWLYDRAFVSGGFGRALRRHWGLYVGLAASWCLLLWLIWGNPRGNSTGLAHGMTMIDSLRTQAGVLLTYIKLVFWPHPLVLFYRPAVVMIWGPALVPGAVVLALLLLTAWALWRRPRLGFIGACFFMILAPTTSVVPIVTELAAERRMYLPAVAVLVLVVLGVGAVANRLRHRLAWAVLAATLVVAADVLAVVTYMRSRDYTTALSIWEDTHRKWPSPVSGNNYALALTEAGRHAEALHVLRQVLADDPQFVDAMINFGYVLQKMNRLERAIEVYEKVLSIETERADVRSQVLTNLAMSHQSLGDTDRAIELLTASLQTNPFSASAHNNLGAMLMIKQRHAEAMQHFRRALELQPENALARGNLARALIELGEVDAASRELDAARRYDPEAIPVQVGAADLLARQGLVDEQIARLRAVRSDNPRDADVAIELAAAMGKAGRYDEAIAEYRTAMALAPESPVALNGLGAALTKAGRVDEAIAAYEDSLARRPGRAQTLVNLGAAYMAKGDIERAMAQYRAAIDANPRYAEAHYNLGNALASQGRFDDAIASYREAVALRPRYAAAQFNLGNALADADRLDEAATALRAAIGIDPADPRYHNNLGLTLARQGRVADAAAAFEQALRLAPDFADAADNLAKARAILGER